MKSFVSPFIPFLLAVIYLLNLTPALAVEVAQRISDREIIEGLAELKAGQKALNQRLDDMQIQMDKRLEAVDKRLDGMDKRLDGMDKRLDGMQVQMDKRLESVDKRLDMLQAIVIGGFGAILTSMLALVGFILWDRRTFIKPVQQETDELAKSLTEERNQRMALEEELKKVKGVLKEWGQKQPELLNALQSAKIL
jgi:predicted nuclease with TOPRIM domain